MPGPARLQPVPMDGPTQRFIRIISNFRRLEGIQTDRFRVEHKLVSDEGDYWDSFRLFFQSFRSDIVLLNNDSRRLLGLCFLRYFCPFQSCRLVSVDIVLVNPRGFGQRLAARLKRFLLRKVNHFIHYFLDLEGYSNIYGISRASSSYLPFKVNLTRLPPIEELSSDGQYVVVAGRSNRDLRTFLEAMRQLSYPAVVLYHDPSLMEQHGTELDFDNWPRNIQAVDFLGCYETWLDHIRRAKLVVVPILPITLSASGISTYLVAMAFRKCVIITEGPATRGLLSDQAIIVPPANPLALARAIRQAWEDDQLRETIADAGRRYAEQVGVEERLLRDIVEICGGLLT